MGYVSHNENEPALFEAQVRADIKNVEAVFFRSASLFPGEWIILQPGPEKKHLTVKIPHVLSVIDMERVELCFSIFREQMKKES